MAKSKTAPAVKEHPPRRAVGWLGAWLANATLWLLLGAKPSTEEIVASLGAATLACVGTGLFRNADRIRFHPTAAMLFQAWRIPGDLLDGAWKVLRGLAGCLVGRGLPQGQLRAARVAMGQDDDPKSFVRRALIVTYTTLTPNTVVLGFVPSQGLMLYHQFVPTEKLAITESLEACR